MDQVELEGHKRWLLFCRLVSHNSPDPSSKVGAVVCDKQGTSVGLGWNSFPCNIAVDSHHYYQVRELKYDRVIHAEMRCLMRAGDMALEGTLYCTHPPCKDCAKHICDAGIKRVYAPASGCNGEWAKRMAANVQVSMQLFAECNVQFVEVPGV